MKTRKNKKGISLIVLVITIIVMIILAAAIIISISNSGIVNRANTAVDETNEKQMKELVSLAWAEAYLKDTTETKDDAYFYDEVIAYLKGSGITDEELDKYVITADKNGADANLKSKVKVKNEYGFYFDTLYLGTIQENPMGFTDVGFVFHEDGSVEGYANQPTFSEKYFCGMNYNVGSMTYSELTGLLDGGESGSVTFADDGESLEGNFIGYAVEAKLSNMKIKGVYYNREYVGNSTSDEAEVTIKMLVDSNNNAVVSIYNASTGELIDTATETATLTADNHIIEIAGENLGVTGTITTLVSADGETLAFDEQVLLELSSGTMPPQTPESPNSEIIPEGGTYYAGMPLREEDGISAWFTTALGDYTGATAVYTAGQPFPTTMSSGDVYVYGDYEYRYNGVYFGSAGWIINKDVEQNWWDVRVLDDTKATYGAVLAEINNVLIDSMTYTFSNCTALTTAPAIPETVTTLMGTFSGCTSLTSVGEIPSSVTEIRETFWKCTALTNIAIPSSITNMMDAFNGCTSLISVTGLSSATNLTMMTRAFKGCSSLASIEAIPSNVTSMMNTFDGCTSLTGNIEINANPNVYEECFANTTKSIVITGSCSSETKTNLIGTATNGNVS